MEVIKMDLNKIKELVAEQLSVDVAELTEETSLKEDLNADSLDLFQIIMSLEEEFGIEIPTEDTESIRTIGDIEKYLNNRNEQA
jgi:acyl carrier protein